MQAHLVAVAILGFACQQAVATCKTGVPDTNIIGPQIGDVCPSGYECWILPGNAVTQCAALPGACKDTDGNCANWAKNGYCTNPFYADSRATTCAKTCNLCSASTCVDKSTNCATWIKNSDFCNSDTYDTAAKTANCQKSCNLC